jgi:hypothetical protein
MVKVTEKATLKLAQRVEGEHIFWKSRQWDSNLPSYFVLANYPANQLLIADDLTGMLIQNAIFKLGGGSVTVGNLFSKKITTPSERLLREAYVENSMDELITTALKHDHVVIATGALSDKSEITRFRLREFLERLIDQEAGDKIKVLVSQNEKEPAHPLSSGVRSSGLPWQLETIEATGLYEKIVKQMATAKIRMEIPTK